MEFTVYIETSNEYNPEEVDKVVQLMMDLGKREIMKKYHYNKIGSIEPEIAEDILNHSIVVDQDGTH